MNIEELRTYCLSKLGAEEATPFGPDTIVYKVGNKMYCLFNLSKEDLRVNLKADPERSLEWREKFPAIIPGYHMNKKHWNTIIFDGSLKDDFIFELIDHSYELVYNALPKSIKSVISE